MVHIKTNKKAMEDLLLLIDKIIAKGRENSMGEARSLCDDVLKKLNEIHLPYIILPSIPRRDSKVDRERKMTVMKQNVARMIKKAYKLAKQGQSKEFEDMVMMARNNILTMIDLEDIVKI